MATIQITYTAPVTVTVNLDTQTVESVSVSDESAEYDPREPAHVWPMYDRHPTAEEVSRAVHIAQTAEEWPAWDFG